MQGIAMSLTKKARQNSATACHLSVVQFSAKKQVPAARNPAKPRILRPQRRLPVLRISQSERRPPSKQPNAPNKNGRPVAISDSAKGKLNLSSKNLGCQVGKKYQEKLTPADTVHIAHRLALRTRRRHGGNAWPAAACSALKLYGPARIRSRSASLQSGMSSGVFRNQR